MSPRTTPPLRADHVGSLGNVLTHDQQRAKLDLIVAVAHDVWG